MSFAFKLSRRLAQNFCLVGAAALLACAGEQSIADPIIRTDTTVTKPDTSSPTQPEPPTPPTPLPTAPVRGYFAAQNGSSAADGSRERPWNLSYALSGADGRIQPGDTLWIRGGTYAGNYRTAISGEPGRLVVVRQYPGERATIDGTFRADGHDVAFWGFEIMSSTPVGTVAVLQARGPRQKFINLVVHDGPQQGITFWDEAVDSELHGNIVYNNGTHENLDHGTYVHNMTGTKLITDNVFFNNLAYGIHIYANPDDPTQRNIHVIGNVSFNNGTISTRYAAKGNILIGADTRDEGMRAMDNLMYFSGSAGDNLRVGYTAANKDVLVTGNYAFGGATAFVVGDWSAATVQNNTFGGAVQMVDLRDSPVGHSWSGNRYYRSASATAWRTTAGALTLSAWKLATGLGSTDEVVADAPTATQVFVRPNKYEQGRANVVVYNHGNEGSVSVSLAGVLAIGQRYEVRNVQNFYGTPVASGTYDGGSVPLPMTGVAPPPRIGRTTPTPPKTGPNFDTFVVVPVR
jgi:hypothetical protein